MAGDIPAADAAVEQELAAPRFRIPNEVWTDVFKVQPRSILVQIISPACHRFKEICDKNVKSVHVIENPLRFQNKLKWDETEANQQLEHLAANKCQLAGQFRLPYFRISVKSKVILRHSLDLFRGCQITINRDHDWENEELAYIKECLSILEASKPIKTCIDQHEYEDLMPEINFLLLPIFLNCSRVKLDIWMEISAATMVIALENIFNWLHHQPNGGVDCNNAADQQVRGMDLYIYDHEQIDLLLNRCSRDTQQGREPIDRRQYVLSFQCWGSEWTDWPGFSKFRRIENKSTGEVLVLDREMKENGEPSGQYRLRRCLAEEEANGKEFSADGRFEEFKFGKTMPAVIIR